MFFCREGKGHLPSPAEICPYLGSPHTMHHKPAVLSDTGRASSAAWPHRSVSNPEWLVQGNSNCLLPSGQDTHVSKICILTCSLGSRAVPLLGTEIRSSKGWCWKGIQRGNSFPRCVFEACLVSVEGNLDQSGCLVSQNNCKFMCKFLGCAVCGRYPGQGWSPGFTLPSWASLQAWREECWTNRKTCRARYVPAKK